MVDICIFTSFALIIEPEQSSLAFGDNKHRTQNSKLFHSIINR